MISYSIIIPVYNESEVLVEIYKRVSAIADKLERAAEIIFVNDGSSDGSLDLMRDIHKKDARVCYLNLARNFGQQIAITAGLNRSRGDAVIVLDADLQDPPEIIPEMIEKWKEGYQIIYGQRIKRNNEGALKRHTAFLFYRIIKRLADIDLPLDAGDFCLMDRKVVDAINAMPERGRYIRGLRSWTGFRQTAIRYERSERFAGKPKYTCHRSITLAINGLISFSKVPLRLSSYLGLFSAGISLFMSIMVLYWRLRYPGSPVTGLAAILITVFFIGSVQLVCIGILGEYVGNIYEEVKGRPLYILSEEEGFKEK